MNTTFLLMAEFETTDIPLSAVCDKYLGITAKKASERAAKQALPFPVFRGGSQKSQWLVRITDLAEYLDAQREKGRNDWKRINAA